MKEKISSVQRSLNLWAIILIIWAIYRAKFRTDLPIWVDEFIAKPVVFLLPIYYFIKRFEKKPFLQAVGFTGKDIGKNLIIGSALGAVILFSMALMNKSAIASLRSHSPGSILFVVLLAAATSISEEILSRGFILKRLYEDSKNIFTSSFFASILFFFLHVPILFTSDKLIGPLLLQVMFNDILLSLLVSFLFLMRKDITIAILLHFFYTVSIYLVQLGVS